MSSDKCTHSCILTSQDTEHFYPQESSLCPFPEIPLPPGNHCSDFYQHRLVLPVLDLHINAVIQMFSFFGLPSFAQYTLCKIHSLCMY